MHFQCWETAEFVKMCTDNSIWLTKPSFHSFNRVIVHDATVCEPSYGCFCFPFDKSSAMRQIDVTGQKLHVPFMPLQRVALYFDYFPSRRLSFFLLVKASINSLIRLTPSNEGQWGALGRSKISEQLMLVRSYNGVIICM